MNQSINDHESEKALCVAEEADLDSFLDSVLEEGLRAVGTDQGSLMLLNSREAILVTGRDYDSACDQQSGCTDCVWNQPS